ncbi:lipopolysaccharide assembly LapA domain-containing protein [Pseudarthrobacter sp. NPDC092184]
MSTGNYPPAGQPEQGPGNHAGGPSAPSRTPFPADYAAGYTPDSTADTSADLAQSRPDASLPAGTGTPVPQPSAGDQPGVTRAGVVWAAVVAALVLLILLIIFILQNQDQVAVRYFGLEGLVPLGMALFIASVTGGVLVAVAGGASILQLRRNAHRARLRQRK